MKILLLTFFLVNSFPIFAESETGATGGGGHGVVGCNCETPGPYGNDTTTSGGGLIAGAGFGYGIQPQMGTVTCVKEGDTLHCQDGEYYKTKAVNNLDRKVEDKTSPDIGSGQKAVSRPSSGR
jgi:hypothetical protein